jgi:Sporulation and spore germination/Immunoglobulin-like domain of bacterial spore germination
LCVKRRLLLLVAAPLALSACGGGSSSLPPVRTGRLPPPPPLPTGPLETTTSFGKLVLSVYFLRDGQVAAAHRVVPATQQVAGAALEALFKGPKKSEHAAHLATAIPKSLTFNNLAVASGTAHVDLSRKPSSGAEAQIVYTLTQFPTVRSVRIGSKRLTRKSFERYTPAILLEQPVVGERVSSPVELRGTANTFEGRFQMELRAGGRRLAKHRIRASSGTGTRGTFDTSIAFQIRKPTAAVLLVYERSPQNGRPIHVVRIPLQLRP